MRYILIILLILSAFVVFMEVYHPPQPQTSPKKEAAIHVAEARVNVMKAEIERIRVDVKYYQKTWVSVTESCVVSARTIREVEYNLNKAKADLVLAEQRLFEYEALVDRVRETGELREPVSR
jgi:hypothetical protein